MAKNPGLNSSKKTCTSYRTMKSADALSSSAIKKKTLNENKGRLSDAVKIDPSRKFIENVIGNVYGILDELLPKYVPISLKKPQVNDSNFSYSNLKKHMESRFKIYRSKTPKRNPSAAEIAKKLNAKSTDYNRSRFCSSKQLTYSHY
eukprot:TRINITY_DN988_c0_g1_i17.p1 TRINITY_DN988_c0_g1~~TRINITY_DN988_c0_g1_i17.p1  ORF type:complete len:147 (-),score=4.89 TRINITY_DN988_c0_g1_i17:297-737(-)